LPGAAGGDEHGAVPPPGADPARRVPLGHDHLAGDGGTAVGADRGDPVPGRVGAGSRRGAGRRERGTERGGVGRGAWREGGGWRRDWSSDVCSSALFPVLQVAMNMALFLPLGLILRGVFRLDTTTSLAMAVLLSALIEVTQYTGAWGLYPCGVRIADIEDLIAN